MLFLPEELRAIVAEHATPRALCALRACEHLWKATVAHEVARRRAHILAKMAYVEQTAADYYDFFDDLRDRLLDEVLEGVHVPLTREEYCELEDNSDYIAGKVEGYLVHNQLCCALPGPIVYDAEVYSAMSCALRRGHQVWYTLTKTLGGAARVQGCRVNKALGQVGLARLRYEACRERERIGGGWS